MNRYLVSFIFTFLLYTLFIGTYFYTTKNTNSVKKNKSTQKNIETIKFKVITQSKAKIEVKEKLRKIKKIKKKIVKKIVKAKSKPKEIVKEIQKVQKVIKKEVIKKEIKIPQNVIQNIVKPKVVNDNLHMEKQNILRDKYYKNIKNTINKNRSYPRQARRRGIEGVVKVKFIISTNGELISYKIIEGKKVFENSVIKAIQKSFPITPPNGILKVDTELSLSLQYILY